MTAGSDSETGGVLTAQTLARVPIVVRWIVEGRPRAEVVDCCREEWGLSIRQAFRMVALAREELRQEWAVERVDLLATLLARLDREYRAASGQNNPGAAIAAVMAQAKIAQL